MAKGTHLDDEVRGQVIAVDFRKRRRLSHHLCQTVKVTSYSQDREGVVPRSMRIGRQHVLIWEILDRWPAQDYRYFKVRTADDAVYFLRHDLEHDEWTVFS